VSSQFSRVGDRITQLIVKEIMSAVTGIEGQQKPLSQLEQLQNELGLASNDPDKLAALSKRVTGRIETQQIIIENIQGFIDKHKQIDSESDVSAYEENLKVKNEELTALHTFQATVEQKIQSLGQPVDIQAVATEVDGLVAIENQEQAEKVASVISQLAGEIKEASEGNKDALDQAGINKKQSKLNELQVKLNTFFLKNLKNPTVVVGNSVPPIKPVDVSPAPQATAEPAASTSVPVKIDDNEPEIFKPMTPAKPEEATAPEQVTEQEMGGMVKKLRKEMESVFKKLLGSDLQTVEGNLVTTYMPDQGSRGFDLWAKSMLPVLLLAQEAGILQLDESVTTKLATEITAAKTSVEGLKEEVKKNLEKRKASEKEKNLLTFWLKLRTSELVRLARQATVVIGGKTVEASSTTASATAPAKESAPTTTTGTTSQPVGGGQAPVEEPAKTVPEDFDELLKGDSNKSEEKTDQTKEDKKPPSVAEILSGIDLDDL
jgi:hypothetical protein